MRRLLVLLLTLAAGIAAGCALTFVALREQPPFGAVRSGAWTAWPDAGTAGADPYARALFASQARVPLPSTAGLRFLAGADDAGMPLDARCDYAFGGPVPVAQYWTLTVLASPEAPRAGPETRTGFTSAELVRDPDGNVAIAIARQARPGNWLPIRDSGRFRLMLSLYDTPLGVGLQSGGPVPPMPSLTRAACR